MAKTYFVLNYTSASKDGRCPINLRICRKDKVKTYATGFSAKPGTKYEEDDEEGHKEGDWKNDGEWDFNANLFHKGKGIKFFVQRREEGGVKEYSNTEANTELEAIKKKANKILQRFDEDGTDWTFQMFDDIFKPKRTDNNFLSYAKSRVAIYQAHGQWSTASILEAALGDLENFCRVCPNWT